MIRVAAAKGSVVIALDQFEEFFTRFGRQPADRAAFVSFISRLVRDESLDVRVIFQPARGLSLCLG